MAMERIDKMHTDFRILEVTLEKLDDDHSATALEKIKKCLNDLFVKSKCKGVIYKDIISVFLSIPNIACGGGRVALPIQLFCNVKCSIGSQVNGKSFANAS